MGSKLPFDVTVTQQGDLYTVSGKDAPKLHKKLQSVPEEKRDLQVGDIADGKFTLQKVQHTEAAASA